MYVVCAAVCMFVQIYASQAMAVSWQPVAGVAVCSCGLQMQPAKKSWASGMGWYRPVLLYRTASVLLKETDRKGLIGLHAHSLHTCVPARNQHQH
jgi:hypothetical protein